MLVKVVAVQPRLGEKLSLEECLFIFKQRPDFVCLPEYFLIDKTTPDFARAALAIKDNIAYLSSLAEAFATCLIGGSVVEAEGDSLYNSSHVFNGGIKAGKYRKLNPVEGEINKGILPGDRLFTMAVDGVRIAVMLCADALNVHLFKEIGKQNVDIIFIPTTSPLRPGEPAREKFKRDNDIYVRGAQCAGSFVVKACGVGELFDKPLQGRSLIASPWGVIKRVEPHFEASSCILTAVLDVDDLRDFRSKRMK